MTRPFSLPGACPQPWPRAGLGGRIVEERPRQGAASLPATFARRLVVAVVPLAAVRSARPERVAAVPMSHRAAVEPAEPYGVVGAAVGF